MLLRFARQNAIALLALFVSLGGVGAYAANTIYSTDIVDGQVMTPDLANGAVSTTKIADNAVTTSKILDGGVHWGDLSVDSVSGSKIKDGTVAGADLASNTVKGAQIDESSLSQVPDSAKLGGYPAADYGQNTHSTNVATSDCAALNLWTGCAPITINIPANHVYAVTVTSMVNAFSTQTQTLGFCPALDGPQCIYFNQAPDLLTAWGGAYSVGTAAATEYLGGPQTIHPQTAVKIAAALNATPNAKTTTTVTFYDVNDEHQ